MADTEYRAVDRQLDVVLAREVQRRRTVLRAVGGGHALVAVPDGGCRGGRKALRDALRPWQFHHRDDEDDDHAA